MQETLAFLALPGIGTLVTFSQQAGQIGPPLLILRPDEQAVAVHEVEPATRNQPCFGLFGRNHGTYQARDAVTVRDPEHLVAKQFGSGEQFRGTGNPAQKAEMRGDLKFHIGGC